VNLYVPLGYASPHLSPSGSATGHVTEKINAHLSGRRVTSRSGRGDS